MKRYLLATAAVLMTGTGAYAAGCPEVTVADAMGVSPGAYPQQFDLAEFEANASCTLSFQENPNIAAHNARIFGNGDLPPLAERLPAEPLVIAPYAVIGAYGGILNGMSNDTESGTSDFMSVRHVNLVAFSDDLQTLVPNVAKGFEWNDDFTQLTFTLRAGHKWSDGAPFTAHDVVFWYNNLVMDTNIIQSPRDLWLAGGEPMLVEALDDVTVRFTMAAPKPGLLAGMAVDYAQPFQPRHFLGQFHPDINPDGHANAQALGFADGFEAINYYYGASDWKDVPSPILRDAARVSTLPAAVVPTLESFITVEDDTEHRAYVPNPYFFMVDTAGNQLPYIDGMYEQYVRDNEVRILKMLNGEIDYKTQNVNLPDAPTLLDGQEAGNYTVDLRPQISVPVVGFNLTPTNSVKAELYGNIDFRRAMSLAVNRDAINSVAFFDLGATMPALGIDPPPPFVTEEQLSSNIAYDPQEAMAMLDALGVVDVNGDGWRDLPGGGELILNMQFTTQGISAAEMELVAQSWREVGVNSSAKEVTSDEYRAAQSANELDIVSWRFGRPSATVASNPQVYTVPFGDYFDIRTGMLYDQWNQTDGAQGIEPPQWIKDMAAAVLEWQTQIPGSDGYNTLGTALVQMMIDHQPFISLVQAPGPIYHSNDLLNFRPPETWSYDYYWHFPYRAKQWSLAR
ncbi:MAG: ABC transporter substrate-binding protein [Paracoccaceae bacterium]